MRRRRLALLSGAAAIVAAGAAACDSANVHILSGQLFDTQNHCLGPVSAVDVVNGSDTGDNCAPECLVTGAADAESVYVTTTCPPYAADYAAETPDTAHDAADPCVGAFAAYDAGTLCSALDGGDAAPPDAGGDGAPGEAGGDASPADAGDGGSADGAADAPAD